MILCGSETPGVGAVWKNERLEAAQHVLQQFVDKLRNTIHLPGGEASDRGLFRKSSVMMSNLTRLF